MTHPRSALFCALLVLLGATIETRADSVEATIDAFVEYVEAREDLWADDQTAAIEAAERLRDDPTRRRHAVQRGLEAIEPDLREATTALDTGRVEEAARTLERLANSDDPWIAAHGAHWLARAREAQERLEEAIQLDERVAGTLADKTLYAQESIVRIGANHLAMMNRAKGVRALEDFVFQNRDAPRPLRDLAERLLEQQDTYEDGGLREVGDLMDESRRRLKLLDPGEVTQLRQRRALSLLDTLIERMEQQQQQQQQQQGQGQGPGRPGPAQGNQQPSNPATDSSLPPGEANMGALNRYNRGRASEDWGRMPPKEREAIERALSEKFPARDRELIEQYFKSLIEEDDSP